MQNLSRVTLCLLAVYSVGCSARRIPQALALPCRGPDWLLTDARVWTGATQTPASAVAVHQGLIVSVGSNKEARAALEAAGARDACHVSLDGRWLLPGLIDTHLHVLGGGLQQTRVDFSTAHTRDETLALLAAYAKAHPDAAWILGRGWSYDAFAPGFPTREELDRAVPDRPVYVRAYDGHTGWANSKALAAAGIDANTPEPKVGRIDRAADGKTPAGTLHEDAMKLMDHGLPPVSVAEKRAAIVSAGKTAAAAGLTTLGDLGGPLGDLDVYSALAQEGLLPVRVAYGPSVDDGAKAYAAAIQRLGGLPGPLLVAGPLKGFVDGVVESNTASLLAPYADGTTQAPNAQELSVDVMEQQMRQASAEGLDIAYHSVGDASVRSVLDAAARVRQSVQPHHSRIRVEHIEVLAPENAPRFAALDVTASVMPFHATPEDVPGADVWSQKLGPARLEHAFPLRELLNAKAALACGSDWPVMDLSPLKGLAVAVTRQNEHGKPEGGWTPHQRITMDEALTCYTSGAARALGLEKVTGRIAKGLTADLVILGGGVELDSPQSLNSGAVELTLVNGRVAFSSTDATKHAPVAVKADAQQR